MIHSVGPHVGGIEEIWISAYKTFISLSAWTVLLLKLILLIIESKTV